jgi:hypothetical protein
MLRQAADEAGDDISSSYAAAISDIPYPLDIIVIDGFERNACARLAVNAVAADGIIILDDSHRPAYGVGLKAISAAGFWRADFYGFAAGCGTSKITSIFGRRVDRWLDPHLPIRDVGF